MQSVACTKIGDVFAPTKLMSTNSKIVSSIGREGSTYKVVQNIV